MDVLDLYRNGKSVVEIAKLTGTRQAVIRGYLRANHRYLRSPMPRNPYKKFYDMRKASELQA